MFPGVIKGRFLAAACVGLVVALTSSAGRRGWPVASAGGTEQIGAAEQIRAGESLSRMISGGQCHAFKVTLPGGYYAGALLSKGDLNLTVTVSGPAGQSPVEFVSKDYGPLAIPIMTEASGAHELKVCSVEKDAAERSYELKVGEARAAAVNERRDYAASLSFAEAERLRVRWEEGVLRESLGKYAEASRGWHASGNACGAAQALLQTGRVYFVLGESSPALQAYEKALGLSRRARCRQEEARALNAIGYTYALTGESLKARKYFEQSNAYYGRAGEDVSAAEARRGQAQVLSNMSEQDYSLGKLKEAVGLLDRALALWGEAGDRAGLASAHLNLGYAHSDSGDLPKALKHFRQSLTLSQAVDDLRGVALAHTAIGVTHSFFGEHQTSLDSHFRALGIFRRIGDHRGEAAALNGIAEIYEDLNEPQTGLDYYLRALEINRRIGNRGSEAVTTYYVAATYRAMGQTALALEYYERCLRLSRLLGKRRIENYALIDLGALYGTRGETGKALKLYSGVLKFYREIGDRSGQAYTLNSIGYLYQGMGESRKALEHYGRALLLNREVGNRHAEASTLYNLARLEVEAGELGEAFSHIEASIKIIESVRTQVVGDELRASYFASAYEHFGLYIDILMRLHKEHPERGHDLAALQASERRRARSLLETLNEARAHIRQGIPPELLERERLLRQSLSAKTDYQMRLLNGPRTEGVAQVSEEIRRLTTELQQAEAQIREQSPRYATLTQPQPLSIGEIQAALRDDGTILLEYALGRETSYLWAVTSDSVESWELPANSTVEDAARRVYESLVARQPAGGESFAAYEERVAAADRQYWRHAAELSRMLLGQVASRLGTRRIIIVADGALQYIPFEALPSPPAGASAEQGDEPRPLVLNHEIVYLPSVSALAALRREGGRAAPPKTVAVMADPVFEKDDPRVLSHGADGLEAAGVSARDESLASAAVQMALRGVGGTGITRLPYTQQEADEILAVTPPGKGMLASGFGANRSAATSRELEQYQIIHFATHGIINSEHPELSGIILSLVDERGEPENGFLHLHDIYNLDLAAGLVVLSGCRTGLGKDVRGEGLVGLTRGFMYAGARSVVASLWKVDDRATAELMKHFYRAMLEEGLPAAAALKKAKEAMWKHGRWHPPYYWAAFTLQGDYDWHATPERPSPLVAALTVSTLVALAAGLFFMFKRHHRTSPPL